MSQVVARPRISDFFLRLADDPALLAEHGRNPRRTMTSAGLTRGQIEAVLNGNLDRVRQTVEAEVAADPLRRHVVVMPRMTTHTPTPPEPDEPEPDEPEPPPQPTPPARISDT
jgi:hypothetical protein